MPSSLQSLSKAANLSLIYLRNNKNNCD